MKKIILILLILLTTATNTFAEDFSTIDTEDLSVLDKEDIPGLEKEDIPELKKENISALEKEDIPDKKENVSAVEKKDLPNIKKEDVLADKISRINSIHDDEQKIKEWAKLNSEKNYLIINKKDCSATVYNTEGEEIKRFECGIGREKGDDFNDTYGLTGKSKNTTPAGEFTLIPNIYNKSAYGDLTLSLGSEANKAKKSKKVVALHKVPKFREKDRLKKFYDGNLANNRMSHGCINFLEKDFKELTQYIKGGFKLYVMPEEDDNELILTKNDKGKFELTQTKY